MAMRTLCDRLKDREVRGNVEILYVTQDLNLYPGDLLSDDDWKAIMMLASDE